MNTFAQSCVPSKRHSLGPLQCLGHAGAMRTSNDIFLIHTFPKNLATVWMYQTRQKEWDKILGASTAPGIQEPSTVVHWL